MTNKSPTCFGTGVPSSGNLSGQKITCPAPLTELCITLISMIKILKYIKLNNHFNEGDSYLS